MGKKKHERDQILKLKKTMPVCKKSKNQITQQQLEAWIEDIELQLQWMKERA